MAIHNHGPGDNLYRSPKDVYDKVKGLDKRMGLCIDIGHVVRIGEDPAMWAEKFKDRLYDIQLKDEDKAAAKKVEAAVLALGEAICETEIFGDSSFTDYQIYVGPKEEA
jgi:sugar phosphate isomerase/epimerase